MKKIGNSWAQSTGSYIKDFNDEQTKLLATAARQLASADRNMAKALGLIFAELEIEEDGEKVVLSPGLHARNAVAHLRRYIEKIDAKKAPGEDEPIA